MNMPQACAGLGALSRPFAGVRCRPGETNGRIGNVRLAADPDRLGGSPGVRLDVSPGRWPVAGAEDLMLPVRRVEMDTDDLDVSATIGHLYQAQADPVEQPWLP